MRGHWTAMRRNLERGGALEEGTKELQLVRKDEMAGDKKDIQNDWKDGLIIIDVTGLRGRYC